MLLDQRADHDQPCEPNAVLGITRRQRHQPLGRDGVRLLGDRVDDPDIGGLGEFSGDRDRTPDAAGKLRFNEKGEVCLGFGKYMNWPLEQIGRNDPGYLQWLMTKAELPGSTLAVMRGVLARLED